MVYGLAPPSKPVCTVPFVQSLRPTRYAGGDDEPVSVGYGAFEVGLPFGAELTTTGEMEIDVLVTVAIVVVVVVAGTMIEDVASEVGGT